MLFLALYLVLAKFSFELFFSIFYTLRVIKKKVEICNLTWNNFRILEGRLEMRYTVHFVDHFTNTPSFIQIQMNFLFILHFLFRIILYFYFTSFNAI